MPAYSTLLEEVLEAWYYARYGVIAELENLPPEQMDFRPTEANRSVRELVIHIVESGKMAAGELSHPDGDFPRQGFPDHLREHAGPMPEEASKDELLALLRSSHEEGDGKLRAAGELQMLAPIRRFDGQPGTRLAWMNHHVAHEEYHRGQLALYARLMGLVPALTQLIQGGSS
jgi:uncharacterized damage-inducible protein DinB